MLFDANENAAAILFFDGAGKVNREMLYTEFEAILDAYVPAIELANKQHDAVYIELDCRFHVKRLVFFHITFNSKGFVDENWSLPLENLASSAASGPNLGGGPIQLACASRCPIDHYRSMLWDPDIRNGKGQFGVIRKLVEANRLGIQFDVDESQEMAEDEPPTLQAVASQDNSLKASYEKELRQHMAQLLKEQRLRVKTVENEYRRQIEELKKDHNGRLNEYRVRIDEKDRLIDEEKQRNQILKDTIDGQADKIRGLREYFEHKLEQAQGVESEQVQQLRENYDLELSATIEAETKELKEMLQMREVELLYRNEQEANLHDEISRLRLENSELVANGGDQLLGKLQALGVSFVTYQPGAGHLTLAVNEVSKYMENPTAYAAEHCGVTEEHYHIWLEHYHAPICRHLDEGSSMCGENIPRVDKPIDYHLDESGVCKKHKVENSPLKLVNPSS